MRGRPGQKPRRFEHGAPAKLLSQDGAVNDRPVPGDAWDPVQYSRFAAERARPFFDLLALVEPCPGGQVIDLGCGTGELTVRLHDHCRADATLGIDSSDAMLAKALPLAGNGLSFEVGDIGRFGATSRFDIVFANASLQWVPDHTQLLRRLARGLRPNGQLAVQVPANGDHPSHALAFEVAQESPFGDYTGKGPVGEASPVFSPERYAELLHEIGFGPQVVRLQVYGHELASSVDVVEWTRGTTLLRFQSQMPPEVFDQFLARYSERLLEVLGRQAPYFYTFKRILIWGRLEQTSRSNPAGPATSTRGQA